MLVYQNNKNLRINIQGYGCCFLTLLAQHQLYIRNFLSVDQINMLYDVAFATNVIGKQCYVNDDNAAVSLPVTYKMVDSQAKIVLLARIQQQYPDVSKLPVNCTCMFIQQGIVNGNESHFILYYADGTLAYNPRPDYMIVGQNTYSYYGIKR